MLSHFEPELALSTSANLRAIHTMGSWLGLELQDMPDVARTSHDGLDAKAINVLVEHGFKKSETEWIVPRRTLSHRLQNAQKLTQQETSRLLRAAKIQALAMTVFASEDKAQSWLDSPKQRFDGQTPKQFMQTEQGAYLVEEALNQLDTGYF